MCVGEDTDMGEDRCARLGVGMHWGVSWTLRNRVDGSEHPQVGKM